MIRAYIGQGLRTDLEHYENPMLELIEGLRRAGVSEGKIEQALAEVDNLAAPDEVPAGPAVVPKPGHEKKARTWLEPPKLNQDNVREIAQWDWFTRSSL